jgi:hypothetical protein
MESGIIDGAIATVMYLAGWATARRGRSKTPAEICQCDHGSAFHDGAGCHASVNGQILQYDGDYEPIKWEIAECPCVRYVGPLSSYVPELDGHTKEIQ